MDNIGLYEKSVSEYIRWLDNTKGDDAAQKQLLALKDEPEELTDSFYKSLTFGTSGIRGILGPGTNRINRYVVRRVTRGLSDYLLTKSAAPRVVISYDSREMSEELAWETARVLSGAGIKAYIFPVLTPVPVLSYSIGRLACDAGVMITASHNPRIFNGYKVYNREGYQVTGEVADAIAGFIDAADYFDDIRENEDNIEVLTGEIGESFRTLILEKMPFNKSHEVNRNLKLVYTPLNGSGGPYVRDVLERSGFTQITEVPAQKHPDSSFATCPFPNPEKITAYSEAFKVLDEIRGDIIIATDPDCDRVGAAIIHDGTKVLIRGNQMGILMLDYMTRFKEIPENPFIIRSIVTTPLVDKIAERHGIKVIKTLTGFKYIGEAISENDRRKSVGEADPGSYYFGFEESCGFLAFPFIRDKDGVSSALLIAEMAAYYKSMGKDLIDRLMEIADEYGACLDRARSYAFEGASGEEKRRQIMEYFRSEKAGLDGVRIVRKTDYLMDDTGLPKADVVAFELDTGETVIIRPSGTEPVVKAYLFLKNASSPAATAVKKLMDAFQ